MEWWVKSEFTRGDQSCSQLQCNGAQQMKTPTEKRKQCKNRLKMEQWVKKWGWCGFCGGAILLLLDFQNLITFPLGPSEGLCQI